jgi:DNA-binding NtrC family response regulator
VQVKLLRVIQNRTVERLGSTRAITVNVRVITGSKRDLRQLVTEGRFREDLFYRLNVIPIALPPLRERKEDIPMLSEHFLQRFYHQRGETARPLSDAVYQAFMAYSWPGNVRELENACERIAQTCRCNRVRAGCVPASVLFHPVVHPPEPVIEMRPEAGFVSLDERLHDVETRLIGWALRASHGNRSKAAQLLKVKRSTLGDRIKKLGLEQVGSTEQ